MKRLVVLLASLTFVSSQASAQSYGLDNADPALFTKFRIPDTDLHSLALSSSFSYNGGKSSIQYYPNGQNSDNLSSNLHFYLSPQYYLLKESDDRYLAVNVNASGNYGQAYNGSEGTGIPPNSYSKNHSEATVLDASETYRNYLQRGDMFCSLGSNAQGNFSEQYDDNRTSDSTRAVVYAGSKQQSYSVTIGIGWGKMRNVTPVVSAIRFQERLKQLNLLKNDLSETAIEDLAQQFYREGYFSNVHVRPDKYFWQDVQNTLSRDGVSLDGLNQYADSYIREVPGELRFMRNEGLVGGVNFQMSYVNDYTSDPISVNRIAEELLAQGSAYVEYSHQLNLDSQVDFNLSLTGGPDLTKNAWVRQSYQVNASADYDYELTDRLVTSINESFGLTFQDRNEQQRYITNNASLLINYFVEDNVYLIASYSWYYSNQRIPNFAGFDHVTNISNTGYVSLGVSYYIDRGLMLN